MRFNKKWVPIVLVLPIIAIAYIVYNVYTSSKRNNLLPNVLPKEPTIVQNYKGKFTVTTTVQEKQFVFPKKMPPLQVDVQYQPLTDAYTRSAANSLGFEGEPTVLNDSIDGSVYFWKNDDATFFAYIKMGKIRYNLKSFSPGINKQISDNGIKAIAKNFVIENKIFDDSQFQLGSIKYLKNITNGEGFQETQKDGSVLYQVSILPKEINYDFISTTSVNSASYIEIARDGSVYSFQITLLPEVKSSLTEYKIMDYNEFISSINNAVLIELNGETYLISDLSSGYIQNVNINNVSISYLIGNGNEQYLQPVFKLTGKATLNNSQNNLDATLYLPAFSKNQN